MRVTRRQSNFELLRIICMLGILIGHVLITFYQDQIHSVDFTVKNQLRSLILNCCAVGMNCFIVISGYFSIRLTKEKFLKFIGQCWWYALISILLFKGSWTTLVFPVSESGLRFVNAYLGLMLVSPLLNAGLNALSGKEQKKTIFLVLLCDVYLGYMHQRAEISADDHNLFHLMCMYALGNLIRHEDWKQSHAGWWCMGCFLLMTALHAVKMMWFPISVVYSLHFNSPMLIVATVLVFLWAKEWKMPQSRVINWVAASVFSVYLIHCNPAIAPHFWGMVFMVRGAFESPVMTCLALMGMIATFFMGCVLVDKVRIWVFDCIEKRLSNTEGTKGTEKDGDDWIASI